jgi:hypothetical protein
MPAAHARVRKSPRIARSSPSKNQPQLALVPGPSAKENLERKPVHGVSVKTVSRVMVLFALTCLAAFMASRPPAAAYHLADMQAQPSSQAQVIAPRKGSTHQRHRAQRVHPAPQLRYGAISKSFS